MNKRKEIDTELLLLMAKQLSLVTIMQLVNGVKSGNIDTKLSKEISEGIDSITDQLNHLNKMVGKL